MEDLETENKLALFGEMIGCCHDLYLWSYDGELHLLHTNCPDAGTLNEYFSFCCGDSVLREKLCGEEQPLLYTDPAGVLWLLFPEKEDGALRRVRVLGPFLIDDLSPLDLENILDRLGAEERMRRGVAALVRKFPIISVSRVQEYAVMVRYLISGARLQLQELRYYDGSERQGRELGDAASIGNSHGTYQAEQEMVRMVREGDLSLMEHINRMSMTGTIGQLAANNTLRSMKNAVFVCLTLFSRAAIEGGLSPESSLSLADRYFQSVEAAKNISELSSVTLALQRDYVERVHAVRSGGLSREIEGACAYIARHLEDEISLSDLARNAGYADYYFSKKFKRETGASPAEYIREKRLQEAAALLKTTGLEIHEVASRLQFCSQSFFSDCFRKKYGVSPGKYRRS